MPPLKSALSRRFSRNASGLLTEAGHGRLIIIGDSSLDVPDYARNNPQYEMYYLGNKEGKLTAAAALLELAVACPIDEDMAIRFMLPDGGEAELENFEAPKNNKAAIEALEHTPEGLVKDGPDGFYEFANGANPRKSPLYLLTAGELAYDCIAVTVGHSQV